MVFSSNLFIFVFLVAFFPLYAATPGRFKNTVLLLASLLFYAAGVGSYVWILLASIVLNYFLAKTIADVNDPWKTRFLWIGIVLNIAPLFYYKYTVFTIGIFKDVARFSGIDIDVVLTELVLPLGISFFTFQAISYLVDVYLGQIRPARRLIDFGAYHALFPQLLAGPIVRYSEVAAQIAGRVMNWERAAKGSFRFSLGLGKKLLIANPIGSVSDSIFALPQDELTLAVSWLGAFSYALQVYYDFSGYSDMAIGLGTILGFDFPENFNQPFRAASITEFWRRWHITLFRWFRDYLYVPLGGMRRGLQSYLALIFVFILCGLWHGAAMTYVIWGGYQGILMSIERYFALRYRRWPSGHGFMFLTFLLTLFGFVVIRSPDVTSGWYHVSVMLGLKQAAIVYYPLHAYLDPYRLCIYAVAIFFAWCPAERFKPFSELGSPMQALGYLGSVGIILLSLISLSAASFNPFIYFRF